MLRDFQGMLLFLQYIQLQLFQLEGMNYAISWLARGTPTRDGFPSRVAVVTGRKEPVGSDHFGVSFYSLLQA